MTVDAEGNVVVDNAQPLQGLNSYFHRDFDDVAHTLAETLSKGDEDEEMAYKLNY